MARVDSDLSLRPGRSRHRAATLGLLAIGLAFLAWRLPSMYLEPGWQDEECYAVPGLTILQSGLPQLPHLPSRNTASPYYRADELLFLEPPLYFYVQAALFALLPDVYGTARLTSALAGVLLLVLGGRLVLRCGCPPGAALLSMGLFMMSRWFYFPASTARPDVLCASFGLLAILATENWTRTNDRRALVGAGVAIGLGGLTHPFALAYAVQMAAWTCAAARGRRRVTVPLALAGISVVVAAAWLTLILQAPDSFALQFRNQLAPRGGSLAERLVLPWESLSFHASFLWPHIGWWQSLLAIFGVALCFVLGARQDRPMLVKVGCLSLSGAVLISVLVGPHHPVFGYFCYPALLAWIGIGCGLDRCLQSLAARGRMGVAAAVVIGGAAFLSMLPGSRIRMNLAYLQRREEVNFNGPEFARRLLADLPPDSRLLVDEEFALDFIREGRDVIAFRAVLEGAVPIDYDLRVASRSTDRYFDYMQWPDRLIWTAGDLDDPYGCYAKVYERVHPSDVPADPSASR